MESSSTRIWWRRWIYRATSIVQRRRTQEAFALDPGEQVLLNGTAPSFETPELATDLGNRVHGIDIAVAWLAPARERCDHLFQVEYTHPPFARHGLSTDQDVYGHFSLNEFQEWIGDIHERIGAGEYFFS